MGNDKVKLRVANIIEEGKLGGPQVRMARVASALEGAVETIIIMPIENSAEFSSLCEKNNVRHEKMKITRITKQIVPAISYLLFSPIEVFRLSAYLKHEKIDLVHASGGSWQYKAVFAARLAGIPSIWHLNDTQMPTWVRFLFTIFQRFTDGFIFASNRSKKYYGEILSKDSRVQHIVPSTVDTKLFSPHVFHQDDSDSHWKGEQVIGTIANVNPIKGLELFIRTAAAIQKDGYNVRPVIVGPIHDNQRSYHREIVKLADDLKVENLVWFGACEDVRKVLFNFDVYICTSVAESSPVSVWEAMSMARPVVSTDVGDVAQHVAHGISGYVVEGRNPENISTHVKYLLDNPVEATKIGLSGRLAAEAFSPSTIAGSTRAAYDSVAFKV